MRPFFVCKQFTMRRDFIADRYWRLWHLPAQLAARGHAVAGIACAYRGGGAAGLSENTGLGSVRWDTCRLVAPSPAHWIAWQRRLHRCARDHRADVIVASSDALQLHAGRRLARALGVPLVVDFYDNYATYGLSRVPGAQRALRLSAREAAAVTVVSAPLGDHLQREYALAVSPCVLSNGASDDFFSAPDRAAAREALGLPATSRLIGTAGALDSSRNIEALYGAFLQLAGQDEELHLVLAGKPQVPPPTHPRVMLLGTIAPGQMPAFWRALDVAAIGLQDDSFGRYCYPQKLAEIAAVGTPMVFPKIGVFADPGAKEWVLPATSNDAAGMATALRQQLASPRRPPSTGVRWSEAAQRFEAVLFGARSGASHVG